MSTDDLLVRRERSDDSQSLSQSPSASTLVPPPTGSPTAASSGSSFERLRNTFRRTENISSQILNHISTQFSNAAAAAAASEIIDGTTTYPYPEGSNPPTQTISESVGDAGVPSPSKILAKRMKRGEF
ncbi:hypothetical protein KR074_006620, partial [Drosophila pseudoananassae]